MLGHISEIVQKKGSHIWSIHPEESVYRGLEIMAQKDIGFLLVVKDRKLVGVVSERDFARKVVLVGKASKTTSISEIMSTEIFFVTPKQTFEEAMLLMSSHHIRHLPVMESEKIMGVISMTDVVQACLGNQMETIQFLSDTALDR